MRERGDLDLVADIAEAVRRIEHYLKGTTYGKFLDDTKTQDAVVRNLEIIGEAVKGISASFKAKHQSVAWTDIARMRDKLVHHYFGVNWEIVWDVTEHKLPELSRELKPLLSKKQRSQE